MWLKVAAPPPNNGGMVQFSSWQMVSAGGVCEMSDVPQLPLNIRCVSAVMACPYAGQEPGTRCTSKGRSGVILCSCVSLQFAAAVGSQLSGIGDQASGQGEGDDAEAACRVIIHEAAN